MGFVSQSVMTIARWKLQDITKNFISDHFNYLSVCINLATDSKCHFSKPPALLPCYKPPLIFLNEGLCTKSVSLTKEVQ